MGLIAHNARWTNYRSTQDARSSAILSPEQACLGIPRLGNFLAMMVKNKNPQSKPGRTKFCCFKYFTRNDFAHLSPGLAGCDFPLLCCFWLALASPAPLNDHTF